MDLILALSLSALCYQPILRNHSQESWNLEDKKVFEANIGSCKRKYDKLPCMKKFIKRGPRRYYIVCGDIRERTTSDKENAR